ncbi:MAG: ABC transporter permease [Acidobacteria bacterium]|nr:ABC transporter permease [Acidobacteriota bacterium]MBV9478850.1 ABC transporter permease [Acidobacteriota bacterium]
MFVYYLRTAVKSLRRNPVLTSLLIGAIALGICVSTTFIALRHIFEKDPVPGHSQKLFYVRMDNWDPQRAYNADDPKSLPTQITYRDMRGLMRSTIPTRQTGSFMSRMFIFPESKTTRPFREPVRLVFSDFFPMFDLPFQYGSGWDKSADAKPEYVVVLDHDQNLKLFGGANSVGRTLRIEDHNYKVVGVIDESWKPGFAPYDLTHRGASPTEGIFIPFNIAPILQIYTWGNSDGWKSFDGGYEAGLQSETCWIQFWVELPTTAQQTAYREYVDNYVRDQKKLGRFQRPLHNEVTSLPEMMEAMQITPPGVKSMSIVSVLFLVVCSLNLVGLLLGKFLARVPEVSVRRALGASRVQVFLQHVVECELIGILGGAIGLALSVGLLHLLGKYAPNNGAMIRFDGEMVLVSLFLALVAGLMAGVYPSWRVCSVAPAMQLKIQ